jgi:hypothetical protein
VTPADRDDERVGGLVLVLEATPGWQVMTVQEVARRLVGGLGAVEEQALWMDMELEWLLDPPA